MDMDDEDEKLVPLGLARARSQ
jgi:hypothetical protein